MRWRWKGRGAGGITHHSQTSSLIAQAFSQCVSTRRALPLTTQSLSRNFLVSSSVLERAQEVNVAQ